MAEKFNDGYGLVSAHRVPLLITMTIDYLYDSPGTDSNLFYDKFTRDTKFSFQHLTIQVNIDLFKKRWPKPSVAYFYQARLMIAWKSKVTS